MNLEALKQVERKRALRARLRPAAGESSREQALLDRLAPVLRDARTPIAFVWPMSGEPDLRPLMHALHDEGVAILLPAIEAPARPLLFRSWQPGAILVAGLHGTAEPGPDAPSGDPATILVPLLAFDRTRHRLGRGGGFYDRTVAARAGAATVGYGYADAEIEHVPTGPHDRRLDRIVTDRGSF